MLVLLSLCNSLVLAILNAKTKSMSQRKQLLDYAEQERLVKENIALRTLLESLAGSGQSISERIALDGIGDFSKLFSESSEMPNSMVNINLKMALDGEGLVNRFPIGVYRTTIDGNILFANKFLAQLLEIEQEKLIGASVHDTINQVQTWESQIEKWHTNPHKAIQTELELKTYKGATIFVRDTSRPYFDSHGNILYIDGIIEDITLNAMSNRALSESEARFKAIVDNLPQLISVVTGNLEFQYVNKSYEGFFKRDINDIVGKRVEDIIGREVFSKAKPYINKVLRGERVHYQEKFEYSKNQIAHMDGILEPRFIDGKQDGYFAILSNVTEYKKLFHALMESKLKYLEFLNMLPQYVFEVDSNFNFTFLNNFALNSLGLKASDIEKRSVSVRDIVLPDDVDLLERNFKKVLSGIKQEGGEYRLFSHKKGMRSVKIFSTLVFTDGLPTGLRGVAFDITELRKNEKELLESQQALKLKLEYILSSDSPQKELHLTDIVDLNRLQQLQDELASILGVASLITDSNGNPITKPSNFSTLCKIIRSTQQGSQNCILSDKHLGEKAFLEKRPVMSVCESCGLMDAAAPIIVDGNYVGNWLIGQCNANGLTKAAVEEYAKQIGANAQEMAQALEQIPVLTQTEFQKSTNLLSLFVREMSGTAFNNLMLATKINEQHEYQAQLLKAKEKAEESDKLKSAFLANISHEIRTPMNGIIGFSEMLMNPNLTNEKRTNFAKIIIDSGMQLLGIINDVLDISKIETGQHKLNLERFNVNAMMLDLHHFFAAAANSKGVRLYVNFGLDDQNAFILSDPIKLRQILTNLLGNSFKFTKMGSIEFGYDVVADMLYFYVKDTGVGISPEHKDDIFDRFRQLESPTTKSYGGTGLGLSISKAFVELMGGKIWFTSEQGKGTTFWFSMPFSLGEEKPMLSTLDKPVDYNPLVLIAEDEEINFFLLKEIISSKGVKVVHAKNGQEAVDMVFANPNICLVLMDIKMPVLNGIDAAREIKRSKPDIPIIAQTAFALEYDKDKLNQSCFDDYVTKPISKQELLDLLFIKYKIAPPSS